MSAIGIDFGNDSCYIAVARAGGIETIANDYSLRATPSCVALGEKQRVMGVAAKNQQVTNIKNTVFNLKRLLGRKFNDPSVQQELQQLPAKTVCLQDGGIGIEVQYLGEQKVFTPIQLVAMLFTKLIEITETDLQQKITEAVISVPSYYTEVERRALLDAAKVAGIDVLKIMNETAAAALCYGIYKQDLPAPEEKPRNVVFVDMGSSSLQAYGASFNKGKLKVTACVSDPYLGGRDFDKVLAEHFNEEFKTTFKVDASNNPRAWLRLTQEAEKLKKQMSANSTVLPLNIECFIDEKDVSGRLKRADMEEKCTHLLQRVEYVLQKLLLDTKWSTDDIYAVELIGGATRVSAIKQLVQKIFNKEGATTLNQDEAVARGCALQSAILSPNFKVREFVVQDIQSYPIDLHWGTGAGEEGNMEVFTQYHQVPFSKVLTFTRKEPFYLEAKYRNDVPYPDRHIGRFFINNITAGPNGENVTVKVKVRVNLHGLFSVCNAYVVEKSEVLEEEPMETDQTNGSKQPAGDNITTDQHAQTNGEVKDEMVPGDNQQTENKQEVPMDQTTELNAKNEQNSVPTKEEENSPVEKKKKLKTVVKHINLPVEENVLQLNKSEITDLGDSEAKMVAWDRQEKDRVDAKNSLEEYVYEIRDKISEELSQFITETDKSLLQSRLQETEDWLYDEGEDQGKEVFNKKLQELQEYGEPAKNRKREFDERPVALEHLNMSIQLVNKVVYMHTEKDEKYAHLDEEDINKLVTLISEKQEWLNEQMRALASLQLYDNPPVLVSRIRQEIDLFNKSVLPIVNKPKPKVEPPPQQPETAKEEPEKMEEQQVQNEEPETANTKQQQQNNSNEQKMDTN